MPLYGLPTNGEHCQIQGFEYNREIAEQYGLDLSAVRTPENLTPVFAELQRKAPDITPIFIRPFTSFTGQVDFLDNGYGVLTEDSGSTVIDLYRTEAIASLMRLFYSWQQSGYVFDYLQDGMAASFYLASGQVFGTITSGKVGFAAQETKNLGHEMEFLPFSAPYSTTTSQSTFWYVIPASCQEPEKAMQLLNLMYTDSNVSNLIMYGLGGVHYRRTSAGSIRSHMSTARTLPATPGRAAGHTAISIYPISGKDTTPTSGSRPKRQTGPLRAPPRWAFNSTPPAFPTSYTAATKSAKNT